MMAKRVFCYRSVEKPCFADKCEEHKRYVSDSDFLGDIYDGREF